MQVVLTIGSCATDAHEPGQVRKEAAISGIIRVPRDSLIRANYTGFAQVVGIDHRCTAKLFNCIHHVGCSFFIVAGKSFTASRYVKII